jgi:nucleotide-binding universal stress UspA family protein
MFSSTFIPYPTSTDRSGSLYLWRRDMTRGLGVTAPGASFQELSRDAASEIERNFEAAVDMAGIRGEFRGVVERHVGTYCADLIITSGPRFEIRSLAGDARSRDMLLKAGCPVLIVPHAWRFQPVGQDVAIAWNSSREAIRAVHGAMPLLTRARSVTVFTFAAREEAKLKQDALLDHLKQHGISAQASTERDTGDLAALDALLDSLDFAEADLIVAGAYSHSPAFEGFFGGASNTLINQTHVAVLMSH